MFFINNIFFKIGVYIIKIAIFTLICKLFVKYLILKYSLNPTNEIIFLYLNQK